MKLKQNSQSSDPNKDKGIKPPDIKNQKPKMKKGKKFQNDKNFSELDILSNTEKIVSTSDRNLRNTITCAFCKTVYLRNEEHVCNHIYYPADRL